MPETQTVEIDGKHLEYVLHMGENPHAPTLIFLHEGLGCVALWRDFPQTLAAATGCHALVYSRFGYGNSDPCDLPRPTCYMHIEALSVLPQLIKRLDIQQHIVIGHSDGGSIALIYAGGIRPKNLLGVITEAAHVFNETLSVEGIRATQRPYEQGKLRTRLMKYHGNNVDYAYRGWFDVWLSADFWHWNIESFLPTINCPTLVIQGKDDHYGTEAQVEAIVKGIGDSAESLLIDNCAHTPHREQRAITETAMQTYIYQLRD
ncbi:MAG: alpha/beta fold hydrolase [Candidatus Promineifilaceae bacterium]